jgi:hypothetical protein
MGLKEGSNAGKYMPSPEPREILADNVQYVVYDGSNVRLELTVSRPEGTPGAAMMTTRHPVCRFVLPISAMNELLGRTSQLLSELEERGVLKKLDTSEVS